MVKREIIKIDEEKCTGCGECVPNCPEGAIQIIDGKARLVSDLFCDGLGACIGHCPEDAITIEEREAQPYDEKKAMENIIPKGPNTIKAHLKHLKDHGETEYLNQALEVLKEKGIKNPLKEEADEGLACASSPGGCPGSRMMDFASKKDESTAAETGKRSSHLRQWPVQLHLVPATAPYFEGADVVLSADCVAYSLADFHKNHLQGKSLAIACPKLDSEKEQYIKKLTSMIDDAGINTLTVMTMEVPCCSGLLTIAKKAVQEASRDIPVKHQVVTVKGDISKDEWTNM